MLNEYTADLILSAQYCDIDDLLTTHDITHLSLRQYCHKHKLPMPPLTDGLRHEISLLSRVEAMSKYRLTGLEINQLFYGDTERLTTHQRAQQLRSLGHTELEIGAQCGTQHYDITRLTTELQAHRDNGIRVIDLAAQYNMSHSRISQLTHSSRPYRRLTDDEKDAIAASTLAPAQLAKDYGTTLNTIYVIRRAHNA